MGESQHDLAKRLCGALNDVQKARNATLRDMQWAADRRYTLRAAIGSRSLPGSVKALEDAVPRLAALEGEVRVLWGDEVLALIVRIGFHGAELAKHVQPPYDSDKFARVVYWAPDLAPTRTWGTYRTGLDKLTALAQEWVAPHVGRDGTRRMNTTDLAEKRKQIDEDIKVMAEQEKAAVDEELAEEEAEAADTDADAEHVAVQVGEPK